MLPDHPRHQRWLLIEQLRGRCRLLVGLDGLPHLLKTADVRLDVVGAGALGGGTHDDPHALRTVLGDQLTQPATLVVGKTARDPAYVRVGCEHEVAPGEADLVGQAGALVPHGILHHLHQHRVSRLEHRFDSLRLAVELVGREVHVAGVENSVLPLPEVDERRLHAGQDVAHLPQVGVADQGFLVGAGHVVLDKHRPFHDHDLGLVGQGPHQHLLARRVGRGTTSRCVGRRLPERPGDFDLDCCRFFFAGCCCLASGSLEASNGDGLVANGAHRALFDRRPFAQHLSALFLEQSHA